MTNAADPFASFFALRKPCANCPFRRKGAIELMPGRLEGIVSDLLEDDTSTFTCHKTLKAMPEPVDDDNDGLLQRRAYREGEKMCAGAAAYLMKQGRPTVGMRYSILKGIISWDQWLDAQPLVIDRLETSKRASTDSE